MCISYSWGRTSFFFSFFLNYDTLLRLTRTAHINSANLDRTVLSPKLHDEWYENIYRYHRMFKFAWPSAGRFCGVRGSGRKLDCTNRSWSTRTGRRAWRRPPSRSPSTTGRRSRVLWDTSTTTRSQSPDRSAAQCRMFTVTFMIWVTSAMKVLLLFAVSRNKGFSVDPNPIWPKFVDIMSALINLYLPIGKKYAKIW